MGGGGGQVVSALAYYSDNPSSDPADVYCFLLKFVFERTKINKKRPGLAHLLKNGWQVTIAHCIHLYPSSSGPQV